MDLELLDTTLAAAGEPAFRARQVWRWTANGARGYDEMTDLPAALRERLAAEVPFTSLELVHEAHSADGTVKALFHTHDGRAVEAVMMRYRDGRRSICVSSQSGCPLTCTFCATGAMKFGRNLTASEILDQVLHFRRIEPVNHLVYMGMGEPMMNLDNVLASARRLPDVGITHRRTTISTVGWRPGIDKLAESDMPIRLAFSLHAPEDALRSQIMPVNERYPLEDVLAACERYYAVRRRMVFIEYVMLAGVNDGYAQAVQLAQLLDPRIFKVNLIPFNPTDATYEGSSREAIAAFKAALEEHGITATVRLDPRPRHRRRLRPARREGCRRCGGGRAGFLDGAFFAGAQQAVAQRRLVLRAGVPGGGVGQVVDRLQPEQLQEQRRGAVQHGAELRAAGLLDQPAVGQRGGGRLGGHAADPRHLGAGDRLQVGDDRQRLGLRGRQRRGARAGEQPAGGLLGVRVRGERVAATDLAQQDTAAAERVTQLAERLRHVVLGCLQRVRELVDRDGLRRQEQQRLDQAREAGHDGTVRDTASRRAAAATRRAGTGASERTVISPNGSSCCHSASPRL